MDSKQGRCILDEYSTLVTELHVIETTVKSFLTRSKAFEKKLKKTMEHYNKLIIKKKKPQKSNLNRKKSGINKESPISNEMCIFMKVPQGTFMARTSVTTAINKYIKECGLQKLDNKRIIVLDATLATLLKLAKDTEITFFDLPRYMNFHFT